MIKNGVLGGNLSTDAEMAEWGKGFKAAQASGDTAQYLRDHPVGMVIKDAALLASGGPSLGKAAFVGDLSVAEVRNLYLLRVDKIVSNAETGLAEGRSVESVAREAVSARNALKVEMREMGSWATARFADVRNLIKYGDRAGQSPDQLLVKYGTWDKVLEAVQRTSETFNKLAK
jgi:hypothetical protein